MLRGLSQLHDPAGGRKPRRARHDDHVKFIASRSRRPRLSLTNPEG